MAYLVIAALALLNWVSWLVGQGTNDAAKVMAVVFFASALALYVSPTALAVQRAHRNRVAIGVVNVLLGWTVLGWVGALAWASTGNTEDRSKEAGARDGSEPSDGLDHLRAEAAAIPAPTRFSAPVAPATPAAREVADGMKLCPFCAEEVRAAAIKCKHCGSELPAT